MDCVHEVGSEINGFTVKEAYLLVFSFGGSDVFLRQDKDCHGVRKATNLQSLGTDRRCSVFVSSH
jgi:hypothetical protein